MTAPRGAGPPIDPGRLLAEFLDDEAAPYEPPVLLPAVLARTALTRRRPAWRIRSWWSDMAIGRPLTNGRTTMSVLVRFMIPVFLVLAGGWYLVANSPGPVQIGAEPSASPRPLAPHTDLEPGTSYVLEEPFLAGSPRLVFTVPGSGWSTEGVYNIGKDLEGGSPVHDIAMTPWRPDGLFADPCHWQSGAMLTPLGPTVADFTAGLEGLATGTAMSTTDVTVGGYPGKRFEFTFPPEFHVATACDNGELWRWTEGPDGKGGFIYGDQQTIVDYVIDVGGIRGVIDTMYLPGVPRSDIAEMEALVGSMRFEWPAASPSPSAS